MSAAPVATVRERPIPFSGPMVRAILDGRKTQTRRVIERQPEERPDGTWQRVMRKRGSVAWRVNQQLVVTENKRTGERTEEIRTVPMAEWLLPACPYGVPGDRLWVRETWLISGADTGFVALGYKARLPAGKTLDDTDGGLDVRQDLDAETWRWAYERADPYRWRSGRFMPRWASRLTLEVSEVRVLRLQEITEEDAQAEGFESYHVTYAEECARRSVTGRAEDAVVLPGPYRWPFARGWDALNSKRGYGWSENPWVWAITFRRIA